jgi:hypothetical protein
LDRGRFGFVLDGNGGTTGMNAQVSESTIAGTVRRAFS